jgi:uncharacterized protein (DUF1697 family)
MTKYIAFLRGINSGGNQTVRMEVLRKTFEALGFENVKTILASGNVIFDTDTRDEKALEDEIEEVLPGVIGFGSTVIIRSIENIQHFAASYPFGGSTPNPNNKPYVTFLQGTPETKLTFPATGKGYTIIGIFDGAICSVVDLSHAKTPDLMQVLDKEFGKGNTTRSWNTIERILKSQKP